MAPPPPRCPVSVQGVILTDEAGRSAWTVAYYRDRWRAPPDHNSRRVMNQDQMALRVSSLGCVIHREIRATAVPTWPEPEFIEDV